MRTLLLLGSALALTACDAGFVDLRPASAIPNTPSPQPDAGTMDGGGPPANPGQDSLVAEGPWQGRADYQATGTASLLMRADGQFELRFSDTFTVSRVPGPVVVLSRRESLSGGIQPGQGDVELGVQAERSGAQSYVVPAGADDRRYVWIYCKPFGLEVGRARLSE